MAVTIGALTLPDLIIDTKYGDGWIDSTVDPSLNGTPIIWERVSQYSSIDLIGGADWGWMDSDTLSTLVSMSMSVGATFTLDVDGTSYTVRFRHEDSPIIEHSPVLPRPNDAVTDWHSNIRVKLMAFGG